MSEIIINVLDKTAGKMKIWLNKNALTAACLLGGD